MKVPGARPGQERSKLPSARHSALQTRRKSTCRRLVRWFLNMNQVQMKPLDRVNTRLNRWELWPTLLGLAPGGGSGTNRSHRRCRTMGSAPGLVPVKLCGSSAGHIPADLAFSVAGSFRGLPGLSGVVHSGPGGFVWRARLRARHAAIQHHTTRPAHRNSSPRTRAVHLGRHRPGRVRRRAAAVASPPCRSGRVVQRRSHGSWRGRAPQPPGCLITEDCLTYSGPPWVRVPAHPPVVDVTGGVAAPPSGSDRRSPTCRQRGTRPGTSSGSRSCRFRPPGASSRSRWRGCSR